MAKLDGVDVSCKSAQETRAVKAKCGKSGEEIISPYVIIIAYLFQALSILLLHLLASK